MLWKRYDIAHMCLKKIKLGIETQIQNDYEVICIGSEQSKSAKLARYFGFDYIEVPNRPLGAKLNAGVKYAKDKGFDYIIKIDSDDIVSDLFFDTYNIYFNFIKPDLLGLKDFYIYDIETTKYYFWPGYEGVREGETIGSGRSLSYKLCEKLNFEIVDSSKNSALDKSMTLKLRNIDHYAITINNSNAYLVDIKSIENITKLESFYDLQELPRNNKIEKMINNLLLL